MTRSSLEWLWPGLEVLTHAGKVPSQRGWESPSQAGTSSRDIPLQRLQLLSSTVQNFPEECELAWRAWECKPWLTVLTKITGSNEATCQNPLLNWYPWKNWEQKDRRKRRNKYTWGTAKPATSLCCQPSPFMCGSCRNERQRSVHNCRGNYLPCRSCRMKKTLSPNPCGD